MVIETGIMSRAYAVDTANVMLSDLALARNPKYKVKNQRVNWIVYDCFCAVVFLISLVCFIKYRSVYLGICAVVVVLCFLLGLAYIRKGALIMKQLLSPARKVTYTLSPEGIEYDNHTSHKVTFYWNSFQAVKIYGAGVYFIPKMKGTSILALPIEYEFDVRDFLKSNNISLEFYNQYR